MNRLSFSETDPRFSDEVRIHGVGRRELMPPGFVSRRKGLPAYLLVLFHDRVAVELAGERIGLEPETAVLWNRNRPHVFGNLSQSWSHSWVVFSGMVWAEENAWWIPAFEHPRRVQRPDIYDGAFARLLREFNDMDRPCLPILVDNIRLMLHELDRELAVRADSRPPPDPVRDACRWIGANLARKITVADVAREACLSQSRIQQLFHTKHGCSVQSWIERYRLQETRYWLMHSGLNIGQIAQRTGFTDGFYLSRRFKKAHGQSPTEYRRSTFGESQYIKLDNAGAIE